MTVRVGSSSVLHKSLKTFKSIPKTVFITGGASGFGRFLAETLLQANVNIAIFDRQISPELMQALGAVKVSDKQILAAYELDICCATTTTQMIDRACREVATPDLAIHCAGILRTAPFQELSEDIFRQVIDVNLLGSRNLAAAVLPHLNHGSHLVLFASLAGIVATYSQAAYAASKFGVLGLAEVLRLELKQTGVDVSVVCPGEVQTPMLDEERRSGSSITKELNAIAGVLSLEQAGQQILRGIGRRQYMITPGIRAKLIRELARKASSLFRWLSDQKLQRELLSKRLKQ